MTEQKETQTLMGGLLEEMNRAREVKALYESIPMGFIGASMIGLTIKRTEAAISNGDTIEMLLCYEELKSIE